MEAETSARFVTRNRLLAALPPKSLARLRPRLARVGIRTRQVLHVPDEPVHTVNVPESGWVSLLATLEQGDVAEIGLIGFDGMVGLPALVGGAPDDLEAMAQAPGTAISLGAAALRQALEEDPALRRLLLRYTLAFQRQVAQTGACNGRHRTGQRLARWLLMAHDRAGGNDFPMTHEVLSMMLGVRRAGITVAAGQFQKSGYISYEKGRITVVDRLGLERIACECYDIQRRAFERMSGAGGGRPRPRR